MRVDRPYAKRPRRTFSDEFKFAAVQNYEADRTLSLANASRLHDVDVKVFRSWVAAHGTGARTHLARTRTAPVVLKPANLGPDPDRPHRPRVRKFLASKPRSIEAESYAELCDAVANAVAQALGEEISDGAALIAELANQNHKVTEHWPPPRPPAREARFTLTLCKPISQRGKRPANAKINPWGPAH